MFIKPLHSEKQMPSPLPNFGNERNKASFHNILNYLNYQNP